MLNIYGFSKPRSLNHCLTLKYALLYSLFNFLSPQNFKTTNKYQNIALTSRLLKHASRPTAIGRLMAANESRPCKIIPIHFLFG